MIRFRRNPWFSLGLHVDHKAPLVDLHLPGVIVSAGWLPAPTFCRTVGYNTWLLSFDPIPERAVGAMRNEVRR